jgi:copper resistance protein B
LKLIALAAALFAWILPALAQQHGHKPVMDDMTFVMVLADQMEHSFARPRSFGFNGQAWIGGDYNRLWINTEGAKVYDGGLEDFDLQFLYGRLVSPYWDLQVGGRYFRPEPGSPSRGSAVIGVQGLAPYWFEIQAATFISHKGEVAARIEAEYDLLLTQRLIAQPRAEADFAVQSVREMGIGRGLSSAEVGLRVRYEIRREFAPYAGLVYTSRFGQTADFARAEDEGVRSLGMVVGVRFWY